MAEETLRIIWLDGSGSNASTSRGGASTGGGSSSAQPAGRPTAGDSATKGPKQESTTSSIGSLLADVADYVGFGKLYKSVRDVISGFDELNKSLDDFFGKREEAKASSGPTESSSTSLGAPPTEPPSAGPSVSTSPADDFIEGEFTPKVSESKALATVGRTLGPQVLEGEVVGGSGALSTEMAAAVPAIEGELAAGAAAAGTSLAGVAAVAVPLTIALAAVAAAVYAFKMGLTTALDDINNLEGYSSQLSATNANNEIRTIMAEINRAERLGPQLAELSDITSRGQEALYEITTEIEAVVLEMILELKPFIDAGITGARITAAVLPVFKEQFDAILSIISPLMGGNPFKEIPEAINAAKKATERIGEILKEQKDEPIEDGMIDKFFEGIGRLGNPGKPPPAPPAPPLPGGMF